MDAHTDEPQANLEALKAAHAEAKAIRREAVKAILDAKRVADAARRREGEAFAAYIAARPPSKRPRPRPKRAAAPATDCVFPDDTAEAEGRVA